MSVVLAFDDKDRKNVEWMNTRNRPSKWEQINKMWSLSYKDEEQWNARIYHDKKSYHWTKGILNMNKSSIHAITIKSPFA